MVPPLQTNAVARATAATEHRHRRRYLANLKYLSNGIVESSV